MARYSGCRVVEGDLEIRGSTLQNLDGLAGIRRVSGRLLVSDNSSLDDVTGLRALRSVDSLEISQNPRLTTLRGLDGIREVRELSVERNATLISLGGLNGVERAHAVRISNNPRLCAQLGLLPEVRDIGELAVTGNAGLSSTDVRELYERTGTTARAIANTIETPALIADRR